MVNPRLPVPVVKFPLKVVDGALPATVRIAEPATLFLMLPVPANEATLLEKPARSKVPVTVNAEVELRPLVEPACRVPAVTCVRPV